VIYDAWTTIDNGREGLWENKVLFETLKIISNHEGEDVHDPESPVYAELETKLPKRGWLKIEANNERRSLFRDYAKPWTATGLLDLSSQKFKLTKLGRDVADGRVSPKDFLKQFSKKWIENGEKPCVHLASAFLNARRPLSFKEIYFGIMLGYRKGDDINLALLKSQSITENYSQTPERRLNRLLGIMEAIGAIAKEDSSRDAAWCIWDTELLAELAGENEDILQENNQQPNITGLIESLQKNVDEVGLSFSKNQIKRFVTAQITKQFVILTGLAGSGKTKLAEAVAYWLSVDPENQICMVAVGADWTNNEPLLGYADALNIGSYCAPATGILQLLDNAQKVPNAPHFLILDEMNLSHVERYFADFLSAMESSEPLLRLHGSDKDLNASETFKVPAKIVLPPNVFIIGTVNVDETTYMFSPKVLDRANVIEFRVTSEQMAAFLSQPFKLVEVKDLAGKGASYAEAFVARVQKRATLNSTIDKQLQQDALELFHPLSLLGAEFGFRNAKEITRFVEIYIEISGEFPEEMSIYKEALDAQVMQKLMPKLHGSARKLSAVLESLNKFADKHDLPLTKDKVKRMQKRLNDEGFTSFAEN
jgi:energy-coupling factor transporter ATP-binding protein EcfA2